VPGEGEFENVKAYADRQEPKFHLQKNGSTMRGEFYAGYLEAKEE
jgi:hypothetical protein